MLLAAAIFGLPAACDRPRPSASSPAPALPVVATFTAGTTGPSKNVQRVLKSATKQTRTTRIYDPAYVAIVYPNGDVPQERGVCSDVIVRAYRAGGVDLQKKLHEDMRANFSSYPKLWGLKRPDPNIDHRRVANLMTYFERKKQSLLITTEGSNYRPGDAVAWELPGGRLHIGLVSTVAARDTNHNQIIHNIGAGTKQEDVLFAWKIIGHYRSFR